MLKDKMLDGCRRALEIAMTELRESREAITKLVDESERILLALQQDGLPQGKYPHFARAIEQAKAEYVDTSH